MKVKLNRLGKHMLPDYDEFEVLWEVEEKTHYVCKPITKLEKGNKMLIPKEWVKDCE